MNRQEYFWSIDRQPMLMDHKPYLKWSYTDCNGHVHRYWIQGGGPALEAFNPRERYYVSTLKCVLFDMPPEVNEVERIRYVCVLCGDLLPWGEGPALARYVLGLQHWAAIDGKFMDPCAFRNLYVLAGGAAADVAHLIEPDATFDQPILLDDWLLQADVTGSDRSAREKFSRLRV